MELPVGDEHRVLSQAEIVLLRLLLLLQVDFANESDRLLD